ncbi:MAG TPA: T9SS type A sorting domain-containing protein, partial [Bacteroidales bacterium]|nr:T9SS type A sorting domain-containing protein [Bacteroidales bacterium]
FFDDFSGRYILPDARRWSDRNVFINNTYSDKQITKGMATFDAIDNKGALYETSASTGFKADQLTSNPINMAYPASDNIWFSFLYEAGGLSDAPERNDSLTLEFYAPSENKWYSVWRKTGSETTGFRNVILPVTQSRYLRKGFRFRFVNYASTAQNSSDPSMIGNCDIWNLDYVLLDRNRNAGDTTFRDVAFTIPVRSVLKNHEAMPWKQFRQVYLQEMGSAIKVRYRNNDTITRNVTRDFLITDMYTGQEAHSFSSGATNISPVTNADYNAGLVYTFNSNNPDSALFRIRCTLKTDEFDRKQNDTAYYYQVFSNYFAFDDGSAEGGYGINGLGSRNAMVATRFTSYIPDTLRAIDISFNDSYLDANRRAFDLMVWDDINGMPGNVIARREEVIVQQGSVINGFFRYYIPGGVAVDGDFYVGWKQRSETFFNAGYDVNTPNKGKLKYWLNGTWSNSQVTGSLMIRPVTGDLIATGINETKGDEIITKPDNRVSLWPNPSSDVIHLKISDRPYTSDAWVSVIDLSGTEQLRVPLNDQIDISALKDGLYILITTVNGKKIGINRLVKTK